MCKSRKGDKFLPSDYFIRDFVFTSEEVTEKKKEVNRINFLLRKSRIPEWEG